MIVNWNEIEIRLNRFIDVIVQEIDETSVYNTTEKTNLLAKLLYRHRMQKVKSVLSIIEKLDDCSLDDLISRISK